MILGIICIIAGGFVLIQSFGLTVLTILARNITPMLLGFIVVGVSILVSGIMAIVYSSGRNRKFLYRCSITNLVAASAALAGNTGDLRLWFVVCLMIAVYYFVRFCYVRKLEELDQNNPASTASAASGPDSNSEDYPHAQL